MKILSLASALTICASPILAQTTLEIFSLPPGIDAFYPRGVDFDGNTIAGNAFVPGSTRAAIWELGSGISLLPLPNASTTNLTATGISASGQVVVGEYLEAGGSRGFRWTPRMGSQGMGTLPSAIPSVDAFAVSADGRVVVGGITASLLAPTPFEPYRWTTGGGFELLNVSGAGTLSIRATAVDAGGARVGGDINHFPTGVDGFAYMDGIPTDLLSSTSGNSFHEVDAFSADGSTLVGIGMNSGIQSRPILWTAQGGVEAIPLPHATSSHARYLSVSGDGSVVIGNFRDTVTNKQGTFLWRRGNSLAWDLEELLVAQGVPGAATLNFTHQAHLSIDGRVIAGTGVDTLASEFVGYRITLQPANGAILSSTFCASQPLNSAGTVANLDAVGTIDASLNALELSATDLPPGRFGYFLASQTTGSGFTLPGSSGNLCLTGALRGLVMTIMVADNAGTLRKFIDQDALPGTMVVISGSTMNFQAWYRDGATSRFTSAAAVNFQ